MYKSLIVALLLTGLAFSQVKFTPSLTDIQREKILAAYRLTLLKQAALDTSRNKLCAKDKECLAAATNSDEAGNKLNEAVKGVVKELGLPDDTVLSINSDKGSVDVVDKEKK